jgi:peptide/nickel transport system ATP-binding protein
MTTTPILTMRDLVIEGFGGGRWKPVVKGVDLDLEKGQVLGLIGESGAGKSTIGLAAMGYTRPGCRIASGSVVFGGQELVGAPESVLRRIKGARIAYVAQSAAAAFNPAHRLLRQTVEGPVQHGILDAEAAAENAVAVYRRLLLPDPERIGYRFPHQVSGGQLQRAMVAMAMSCRPDIIVFDEPTTALDVTTQIEVLAAIKEVTRELDTAAIYITHDLAVVAQLADRIMVLRHGETVEENDARELLAHPRMAYTRDLLSVRSLEGRKRPPADEEEVILEVEGVSAAYPGGEMVLKDIHLTVRRGLTIALVGESGSGKSTLARVATGLLPPVEGEVRFQGRALPPALGTRERDDLRRLQMIYQMPDTALNPRQRIRKILGRPLQFYFGMDAKAREKKVRELLEQIELPPSYIDRYPTELSGGEKQRICIARALAAEPDLIICDEVTSALDQLVAEGILQLLKDLQRRLRVSYLFITHDLATVKAVADEIVVMLRGRIVEKGPKEDVLTPPHHEYTERLLASVPEMDPDWLDHLLEERDLPAN